MFKIGIVDTDEEFITRLKDVFDTRFPNEFKIIHFPSFKQARTAVEKAGFTALLINSVNEEEIKTIPEQCKTALLTENRAALNVLSIPAVCKYQSIDEWHEFLVALCRSESFSVKGGEKLNKSATEICLFTSTGGGVGASAAAAAFCVECAAKGKKVVYLNFETLCSTSRFFFGSSEYRFDDIFFALRSKKYELAPILQKAIIRDARGVWFVEPCKVSADAFTVTGEEIIDICETISKFGVYDLIVIDMNFESTENIVLPFLKSKLTVLVNDGSVNSNYKMKVLLSALPLICGLRQDEVTEKTALLYNRFITGKSNTYEDEEMIKLGGIVYLDTESETQLILEIAKQGAIQKLFVKLFGSDVEGSK